MSVAMSLLNENTTIYDSVWKHVWNVIVSGGYLGQFLLGMYR